jgi:uncharacterized protein YpiB (UPF0302 family)
MSRRNSMAKLKKDILLEDSLYEQISTIALEMQVSENELFALAIEDYLHRRRSQKLLKSIDEAYADGLDPSEKAMLEGMRRHQRQIVQ